MRWHRTIAAAILVASCGGTATTSTTTTATSTTTTSGATSVAVATSSTTSTTAGEPSDVGPDRAAVERYLVALSNILGEESNGRQACEEATAAEQSVTETSSSEEIEAFLQAMFVGCMIGSAQDATESLAQLPAQLDFAELHDAYVSSRHTWVEVATSIATGLKTMEDAEKIFENPDLVEAGDAVSQSCLAIESQATRFGIVVSLGCPASERQSEPTTVEVRFGPGDVTIEPAGVIDSGGGVRLAIEIAGERPRQPVVATLFSGDPGRLPLSGDRVDVKQSGVVFSEGSDPGRGYFALNWPEVTGEDWDGVTPELGPGDGHSVDVGPGRYVVFDNTPGAYETGAFAVLVVASSSELEATYVAPAIAATSCSGLAAVVIGLFTAYVDEVSLLTAESFLESPLSMVDDLRFGAALQRGEQLGCDAEAQRTVVTDHFCPYTGPMGSAAGVILGQLCEPAT